MIIVTGSAGFIGYHLCMRLLEQGHSVLGIDTINDYYDVVLKQHRLKKLGAFPNFTFKQYDVANPQLPQFLGDYKNNIRYIFHLAAQAGVRASSKNALDYGHANMMGHLNMLEYARILPQLNHFIYASSSSVYGDSEPTSVVTARADQPLSIYAATKRSGELLSSAYAHLYDFNITGVRFFTAYGSYGRPDMAYYMFAHNIMNDMPIHVHNDGLLMRDFTYIDDIINGVMALIDSENETRPLYNFGSGIAHSVNDLIDSLEKHLNHKALRQSSTKERTEVSATLADISVSKLDLNYTPTTSLDDGIGHFVAWFKEYHGL